MSGSNQNDNTLKAVAIVFTSIGSLVLIVSTAIGFRTYSFIQGAEKAEGSVIELIRKRSSSSTRRSYVFHPVVEFETANGESVQFESNVGSRPPAFQPGESVTVLYHPENVNQAMIDSFWNLWLFSLIAGVNGSVFFSIGVFLLYLSLKPSHES